MEAITTSPQLARVLESRGAGALLIQPDRPAIPTGPQSVAEVLDAALERSPDATAVIGRRGRMSYRELEAAANRAANALRDLGLQPGDRIGASLPNDLDIVVLFMAVMRLGAVWVGIPRVFAPGEKAYVIEDAEMSMLLADPQIAGEIDALADRPTALRLVVVDPDDPDSEWARLVRSASEERPGIAVDPFAPAAITYTSGTTGRPKGVVHSQHNLILPGAVTVAGGEFPPDGPIATSAPFTILNLLVLVPLTAFQAGTSCVIIHHNAPEAVAGWIERERIMHLTVVPTVYHDLLGDPAITPERLTSLKRPRSGGAAVTETLRSRWLARFGYQLTSSLAMTEAPTFVTREDPNEPRREGSLGRALPHIKITIVDPEDRELPPGEVGEICVSAATSGEWAGVYTPMLGYWGKPEETRHALRGGMLHTGDIGRLDADGTLYLVDRKSSLIIRGGSNIYPAEVERVLDLDPTVGECVLVARPDERLGETTVAFVCPRPGATVDVDELKRHCAQHLARYKVPDEIVVVDEFPRTALGKIHRAALVEVAAG